MEKSNLHLPENEEEKILFVRDLFGKSIVNNLDYWLSIATDLIQNEKSEKHFPRKNESYKKDKKYRETFSKLDFETKETIVKLINSVTSGAIYSILLDLDRFHSAEINITYKSEDIEKEIPISSSETEELHLEYWEWIEKYSKFKESLLK